jgi:hypothetical protein
MKGLDAGGQLSKVFSPIVMAILFFAVVTPLGLIIRLAGRDPLRQHLDRNAASYWLARGGAQGEPETSMTRQS